jgi:hypothetical protein
MGLGYSNNLPVRVIRAVEKGAAAREAARPGVNVFLSPNATLSAGRRAMRGSTIVTSQLPVDRWH